MYGSKYSRLRKLHCIIVQILSIIVFASTLANAEISFIPINHYDSLSPKEKIQDIKLRWTLFQWDLFGREDQAKIINDEARKLLESGVGKKDELMLRLLQQWVLASQGDSASVESSLETIKKSIFSSGDQFLVSRFHIVEGLVAFSIGKFDRAIALFERSLEIYKNDTESIERHTSLYGLAESAFKSGNNNKAIAATLDNLKLLHSIGYKKGIAQLEYNLGGYYRREGQIAQALDYFFKSLEYFKEVSDASNIVLSLTQIALSKAALGQKDEVLSYYLKTEDLLNSEDVDPNLKAHVLSNIYAVYADRNDFDRSIHYYQKALSIAEKHQLYSRIIYLKTMFAADLEGKGDYNNAISTLDSLKNIDEKYWTITNKFMLDTSYFDSYVELGNLEKAKSHFKNTQSLLESMGRRDAYMMVYERGIKLYRKLGDLKNEYKYYRKHRELKEKVDQEKGKKLLYARENELLKKDIKIKETEKNLQLITGSSLLVLLLLIVGVLFYNRRKTHKVQSYIQKKVLARFLPPSLIDEIMTGKSRLDIEPTSETITVLFCDIVGFTKIFSSEQSEIAAKVLNRFLREITEVIYSYNGTIDKFIGDAVMVLFGAPVKIPRELQAQRAVDCGKAMIQKVKEMNLDLIDQYGITVRVRIGINQGEALVGTIGGEQRSDFTAIGHTVNVASRVEGHAKPQQILFTKSVAEWLNDDFKSAGEFSLKGVEEIIELFCISLPDSVSEAS